MSQAWAKRLLLIAVPALSALTMVWLFWHYPVKTGIGTLLFLAAFSLAARLARWIETDATELGDGEHTPT